MTGRKIYENALEQLSNSRANMRCADLTNLLNKLGFEVRDGKRGGHKVFVHDGISGFYSDSYNCGHGKNPEIKPAYIRKIERLLHQYKDEIVKHLEKGN